MNKLELSNSVKEFIENNIDLIEQERWDELYHNPDLQYSDEIGELTSVLLSCGINPIDNMTLIPSDFFYEHDHLLEYRVPSHITKIESGAFENCKNLKKLVVPTSVTDIERGVLKGCDSIEKLVLPVCLPIESNGNGFKEFFSIGHYDRLNNKINYIEITNETSIPNFCFDNLGGIGSLVLHEGLKSIGNYSLDTSIDDIYLPRSLRSIGQHAFMDRSIIHFSGSSDEWTAISKFNGVSPHARVTVHCIDKTIEDVV